MISKYAINDYLDLRFDNHLWIKDLSEAQLDRIIADMHPCPDLRGFPLRKHQKVCFILCVAYPEFYLHLDMGTGKTVVVLAVLRYFLDIQKIRKALVLVPRDELVDGWEEQIEEWCPELPRALLKGASDTKWDIYEEMQEGLAIASYPGLVWMCSEKEFVKRKGKKGKNELVPKRRAIDRLLIDLDALVLDEATKVMNHGSLIFRICNQISKDVEVRYGLAGRMFGRDPEAAWAQLYLIDRGESFGTTLGFFREVFFTAKKSFFGGPHSMEYKFNKEMDEDFNRAMNHRSIRYDTEETDIILPPVITYSVKVDLPAGSQIYYQRILEDLKKSRGNWQEVQSNFLRLRQISSGFVGFKDDDTGEKAQLEFEENPKLDRLLDVLDRIPEDRKFVIAVDFTWSGARISQELRKLKIKFGWLYGGTKDWPTMKRSFDRDPEFRGLIVQNQKGSYGLNLQSANYLLVFERPVPVLDWDQLQKRLPREGQKHTVFQYEFIMRKTTDESIVRFHREGKSLFKALALDPESVA